MRDCIICGDRAGSAEHLFPAALGGRRTNKGIYCSHHNSKLSISASVLAAQLLTINSILEVENDHTGRSPSFIVEVDGGEKLRVQGSNVSIVAKDIEVPEGVSEWRGTQNFSSEAELQKWISRQRSAGFKIVLGDRQPNYQKWYESPTLTLSFGGEESLRATGYVALTHFAHHFPVAARDPGLRRFKDYIQGLSKDALVGWAPADTLSNFPENPFMFGHSIIIGIDKKKSARAIVSFFGCFTFFAEFGYVEEGVKSTVMVHIDPLALHPPDDIQVSPIDAVLECSAIYESHEILNRQLESGELQKAFLFLLEKLSLHVFRGNTTRIMPRVAALTSVPDDDLEGAVLSLIQGAEPRAMVLQLIARTIMGLRTDIESVANADVYGQWLSELFAYDSTRQSGLSQNFETMLILIEGAMQAEIILAVKEGDISFERINNIMTDKLGWQQVRGVIVETLQNIQNSINKSFNDMAGPENF